jgi:hypothetical protein
MQFSACLASPVKRNAVESSSARNLARATPDDTQIRRSEIIPLMVSCSQNTTTNHCRSSVTLLRKLLYLLVSITLFASLHAPANAHDLPPVVDEFRLIAQDWSVSTDPKAPPNPGYMLIVNRDGASYTFPIELGFIAQSVAGNGVAEQDVEKTALGHIQEMAQAKGILIFKVASLTANGDLFVRSFKIFDIEDSFHKACQLGSPILNRDNREVAKMGLSRYRRGVEAVTDADWVQVQRRPRSGERQLTPVGRSKFGAEED